MSEARKGMLLVISGASGTGKGTVIKELMAHDDSLVFSVSATTRSPRPGEENGREYYFISEEEFARRVENDEFIEYAPVFAHHYGTLRSELERIWSKGHTILFDVDVMGGINLKRIFGRDACSIFIMPPSIEELERRLQQRGTDAPEVIARRVAKAGFELTKAPEFDHTVVNDRLDTAVAEVETIVRDFLA